MKKKLKMIARVTNKNILMRFRKEQEENPSFTLAVMAEKFGILNTKGEPDRSLVGRWTSLNSDISRLPSKSRICPHCRNSVFSYVEKWINDGKLQLN